MFNIIRSLELIWKRVKLESKFIKYSGLCGKKKMWARPFLLSLSDLIPNKLISGIFYFFRFFPIQEKNFFFFSFFSLNLCSGLRFCLCLDMFFGNILLLCLLAFAGKVVKAVFVNFVLFGYFICNKKGVKHWICFHFSENNKVIEYKIVCSGFVELGNVVTYHWLCYMCTCYWRGKLEYQTWKSLCSLTAEMIHKNWVFFVVDIFFKDICKLTSRVSKTRDCFRLEFHVHQGASSHLHTKVLVQCNLLIENNQSNNRLNLKNVICYIF